MDFILALDQGTTSSRALLVDHAGAIHAVVQREFRQYYPQPGWVEHDAVEIASTQLAVAAEAVRQGGDARIAAIGITNQRETTIVWERVTGRPIHHAIVWQDRRTAEMCEELKRRGLESLVRERTGLLLDPYFSGTKLRWILDHVDGARARAHRGELAFGTVDSWIVWNLTKGRKHVTDATNASRTLLYDIHRGSWDDELLAALDIPRALLPEVTGSSEIIGESSCEELPLAIPIAAIAGDQQAALFGQRCLRAGMVKTTYGTGSFIVMNTGEIAIESKHKLLSTIAWRRDGEVSYAIEGSVFVAGALVQWLRDKLGIIRTSGEIEQLASRVPDAGGVFVVPAFAGLGAPHWDAEARGAILGLTLGSKREHIARAALEAIAFQVAEVVMAMQHDVGLPIAEMRVDGGASVNDLLMQLQADVIGVPVVRSASHETTALGAAYFAGLAVGFWSNDCEVDPLWRSEHRFEPRSSEDERLSRLAEWDRAVGRTVGWTTPA